MLFDVLVLLAVIAALLVLNSRQKALKSRLASLDGKLEAMRAELAMLRGGGLAGPPAAAAGPAAETPAVTIAVPAPAPPERSVPAVMPAAPAATAPVATTATLEEKLGTRWAVWVGGLALALGGVLLVRYTIEAGLFGPGARIAAGALLALLLTGLGEWLRRRGMAPSLPGLASAHVPSILTAAGTMTAFATAYAAHGLYGFLGPAPAFVILGAIAVATMLAAALHGPALAALGLVGAYVAPLLVTSSKLNPWPVVLYLGAVAAAAMGLARLRQWLWLAMLAIGGAFVWGILLLDPALTREGGFTLAAQAHALIQLALAAGFLAIEPHLGVRDQDARLDQVAGGALLALTLLVVATLADGHFALPSWLLFAAAAAAVLVATAWMSPPAALAAAFAGVVVAAVAGLWPGLREPPPATLLAPYAAQVLRLPENVTTYLTALALLATGTAAASGMRLWRGPLLDWAPAGALALAATLTPLAALGLAYVRVTQFDASIPFAVVALVLALAFTVVAERSLAREDVVPLPAIRLSTGAFAAASVAAFGFALVAFLSRGYLTVALALAALGTAWVATIRDIPMLRIAVAGIGVVVLGRIVWDPVIFAGDVGRVPILNWLLIGYGVPALAFATASRLLLMRGEDLAQRLSEALAVILTFLLVVFQIRHLVYGDPLAVRSGHLEQGLFALAGFLFAYALRRLDQGRASPVFRYGSMVLGGIAALVSVLALVLFTNPLLDAGERVAGPAVFSSLLLAYLAPGIASAFLARTSRGVRPQWYVNAAFAIAGLLVFLYVTLAIRHVFQGEVIVLTRHTSGAEHWAHSAGWLTLGIVYLLYGLWRRAGMARLASAVLVVLAVLKVFLYDLSGLTGPWRAFSFITLGAVLIGIGLLYQRLMVPTPPPKAAS